jgi:hypothetical protein
MDSEPIVYTDFDRYRVAPLTKAYKIHFEQGAGAPWRVVFFVDGEQVGGGQFQTAEQADDAGVDFMFDGWGDD